MTERHRDHSKSSTTTSAGASSDMTRTPGPEAGSNILLVYFSRGGENYWNGGRRRLDVGNTKRLGRMISDRISCDTYEIAAADPYPDSYDTTVARSHREQDADSRPRIAGQLPDTSSYDTVILGSPVWDSRTPMIMSTFIDDAELAGKTVLPFVTYAVSGMSGIDADYRAALPNSTVGTGLAVRGEDVSDAGPQLDSWVKRHRLPPAAK